MASKEISEGTVHKLPADLKQALIPVPAALTIWNSLTPLARMSGFAGILALSSQQHVKIT